LIKKNLKILSLLKILSNTSRIILILVLSLCRFSDISAVSANDYNIIDYGAKPDSKTLNQDFIQKAIDSAFINGGGRVVIPGGTFLTGSIILKSNVELHLEEGAVLLGSTHISDYKKLNRWKALILADGQDNIKITGSGIVDGQGRTLALNSDSLYYAGKLKDEFYNKRRKRPSEAARAQIIELVRCTNVLITGITLKNSSSWVETYSLCKNLIINKIKVESDAYWNNDGLDVDDCKNVKITDCQINSADDGICLKSSDADSFNDSIYVSDCVVRSSASAIKFGTASAGGFKNIYISNIKVFDTFRSAIALESVDGGTLENVEINNVFAVNTGNAIFIKLGHRNKDGKPGVLKNVKIKNVQVQVPFGVPDKNYDIRGPELPFFHNTFPASITGIPEKDVENVFLENITVIYPGRGNNGLADLPLNRLNDVPENESEYPEFHMFGELPSWGFYVRHVDGITMKNICLIAKLPDYRPSIVMEDVKNLNLEKIQIVENKRKPQIILKNVSNINIDKYSSGLVKEMN
jgi:polygalacturonase